MDSEACGAALFIASLVWWRLAGTAGYGPVCPVVWDPGVNPPGDPIRCWLLIDFLGSKTVRLELAMAPVVYEYCHATLTVPFFVSLECRGSGSLR